MKKEVSKLKEHLGEITKQNDILKKKYSNEVEQMKLVSEDDLNSKSEKITEQEQKIKTLEESFDIAKQKWEKDQAIYKQKQEFLELQLKEERNKNDDQKQTHDTMFRNLQNRERESVIGKEEANKRINDVRE